MRAPGRGTITCTRPCTLERLVPTDSRHALIRRRVQYLRGATTDVSRPCRSAVSERPELRQMRRMCRAVSMSNVILILASLNDGLPMLLGRRRVPRGYAISRPGPAFESEHDSNWRLRAFVKAQLASVRTLWQLKTCSLFWCQVGASDLGPGRPKLTVGMRENALEKGSRAFSCKKLVRFRVRAARFSRLGASLGRENDVARSCEKLHRSTTLACPSANPCRRCSIALPTRSTRSKVNTNSIRSRRDGHNPSWR